MSRHVRAETWDATGSADMDLVVWIHVHIPQRPRHFKGFIDVRVSLKIMSRGSNETHVECARLDNIGKRRSQLKGVKGFTQSCIHFTLTYQALSVLTVIASTRLGTPFDRVRSPSPEKPMPPAWMPSTTKDPTIVPYVEGGVKKMPKRNR